MLRKPAVAIALTGAALSGCGSAWAHGALGDTSIWTASYHLFTSPLSLAALAAMLAALFSPQIPAAMAPAAVVIIGLGAVAGWKPSAAFRWWLLVKREQAGSAV